MTRLFSVKTWGAFALAAVLVTTLALVAPQPAAAQATVSTGSIEGTITDPTGAAVPGAKVAVTNKSTGQSFQLTATTTGAYNSGPLIPGNYVVRIEAKGFKTVELPVVVNVGVISSGSVSLQLGAESTIVQVAEQAVALNTEQATVQGVMTTAQIDNLPFGGRNFLDLAQLEPGVQIQDGANFDPTKNGFSSISFGGRFGRTARIEVDGVDISDETVGTTTQNLPASAIKEFQVSQSSLDLSTELTSSGTVNVVTNSGTNAFHGSGFFYGRSDQTSARIAPRQVNFARKQYGADLGGPIFKDKLFFYGDWERSQQDLTSPVTLNPPFTPLAGTFNGPFRESEYVGKLDWQAKRDIHLFYRFSYDQNRNVKGFIPNTFQPFANVDHVPVHAAGADFNTGSFTHSVRFGWMKFRNAIADSVLGSSIFNPGDPAGATANGIDIAIGGDPFCLVAGLDSFCSGPNFLAPQATYQKNAQAKYDGSKIIRSHILRYGFGYNHIQGGGFAAFVAIAPIANSSVGACLATPSCLAGPGGSSNPLNYPLSFVTLGNGQGFFTEKPAFSLPAGGQEDNRIEWYAGDTWKVKPNFTLNYGVKYVRDTGRSDSDLGPIPALNQFGAGLGNRVNNPSKNFGYSLGIAWDPWKSGKTVIRAGSGVFYENAIYNNVLFDRPVRLQRGLFFALAFPCPGGSLTLPNGTTVTSINGHNLATQVCGQPIGNVINDLAALQQLYQSATKTAGPQANGSFIGNTLADGSNSTGNNLIGPDYRSPYSWQMNVGVQRQLRPGTVLSVDYIRNVGVHYLLDYDTNHVGAARFLDTTGALNAINATNAFFGCAAGTAGIPCAITAGATIVDYASHGLDSGTAFNFGLPCGPGVCAFPGVNANLGQNQMLFPIGRSTYNGLQISLRSQVAHPAPGLRNGNFQVSYSFSRFISQVFDQDFISAAPDFSQTGRFIGPNALDRKHQFSAGGFVDLPLATRLGIVTHFYTNLPANVLLPTPVSPAGAIFTSDLTGDGTFAGNTTGSQGDFLPGTNIGSFGRDFSASQLNNMLNNYNNSFGGRLTPAGQALVNAGLFTQAQLIALCAYAPTVSTQPAGAGAGCGAVNPVITPAPAGQENLGSLFSFDMRIGWVLKPNKLWSNVRESLTIEPQINIYNLFNRQNFDSPSLPTSGILNSPGSINTTTKGTRTNLVGLGSGLFGFGAPRQVEFGAKITF